MAAQPTNADLRIDIAVVKRDLLEVKNDIEEVRKDLASIRGYFFKFLLGIGSLIGAAVVRWILSGGLASFGG